MMNVTGLLTLVAILVPAAALAAGGAAPPGAAARRTEKATFAGGCFWCMEPAFEKLEGVISVTSGYTGGHEKNPTYEEVSSGATGHAEAVEVVYDPAVIGYGKLLEVFWRNIDPLTPDRQFCDVGKQYRTAVFTHGEAQRKQAEESKRALEASGRIRGKIVTEIVPAGEFYPAEEYHQGFSRKDPFRYETYRASCGRDRRLRELWGGKAPDSRRTPP